MTQYILAASLGKSLLETFLMGEAALIGGGALIEGTTLAGAKILSGKQGIVAKVGKYALGALAAIAAIATSLGIGLAVSFGAGALIVSQLPIAVSLSLIVLGSGAVLMAPLHLANLMTPLHWKAFHWAHLV